VIDAVTPHNGQQGTVVRLTGTNLLGGGAAIASVTLAGATADVRSANNTAVTAIAGPNSDGVGDIVVTADSGAIITLLDGFTYEVKPETLNLLYPIEGRTGTRINICGEALLGGGQYFETVLIGDTEALILFQNSTCLIVEVQS